MSGLLSKLGGIIQFATAGALLAASFLIQREIVDAHASPFWLATAIAALLVVGRASAVWQRHSSPDLTFSLSLTLGLFRLALSVLALGCSVDFFFNGLNRFNSAAWRAVIRLYRPPVTDAEQLLALSLFLGLLLELALTVVLGQLARACAPLLRAERDYRLRRCQQLSQVATELRLARAAGLDLREGVSAERGRIERRLREAVVLADAGKLAE
ncbi:MAG: hypothetical protein V9G63_09505 [Candidatus Competibacter sp.]|nr:hypothetical protein [Candidatus Competibacteraceae bacterium]